MVTERRTPPPLDAATLERLALRYVERFATTRGKLADYLTRKVRERGWAGEPADLRALPRQMAERMAELGYVDDHAFAEAKAAALARRGLGARRVSAALHQARIGPAEAAAVAPAIAAGALEAALTFARRRRIGPYGDGDADHGQRERQLAQMLRAGHGLDLSRRVVAAPSGKDFDPDALA